MKFVETRSFLEKKNNNKKTKQTTLDKDGVVELSNSRIQKYIA